MITAVATGTIVTRQFQPPRHPENFIFRISASDSIQAAMIVDEAVSYTHLRAHETVLDLVCRLLLEKKTTTNDTDVDTI